jgi:lysophospholipase L1-like esterase
MAGTSIALIAVLEGTLRVFFPQTLVPTAVRGKHFSVLDPTLGMRYVPGAVYRFRHPEYTVEYAINEEGLRTGGLGATRQAPQGLKLLLLGDSFTFGQGVPYEMTWGAVAERELRALGVGVETINAGMQGMDTRSELLLLRELRSRHRPDVVVLGFLINDLYTNLPLEPAERVRSDSGDWSRVRDHVFVTAGSARTFHLLELARRIVTSNDAVYTAMYLAAPDRGEFFRLPLTQRPRRQLEVTDGLFRQLVAECRKLGVPLVVVSIPQQFQVLYRASQGKAAPEVDVDLYDRHFAELGSSAGFTWIPTLESLARAKDPGRLFYRLDGHLSPAGHAIVGEVLAQALAPYLQRGFPLAGDPEPSGTPPTAAEKTRPALDKDKRRGDSVAARALTTR